MVNLSALRFAIDGRIDHSIHFELHAGQIDKRKVLIEQVADILTNISEAEGPAEDPSEYDGHDATHRQVPASIEHTLHKAG